MTGSNTGPVPTQDGAPRLHSVAMIKVKEPFSKVPKIPTVHQLVAWDGDLEPSRGFADISNADLENATIHLEDLERIDVEGCRLGATTFDSPSADLEISIAGTVVERSDLSRLRLTVVRQSRLIGVKLTGTDFSGSVLRDVEFVDCMLRLTSLRMAELERVTFTNCIFDDVDAYSAGLTDVSFPESRLNEFNLDQTTAVRVDLRHAQLDGLKGLNRLDGILIAEHQLPALAFQLAAAVGLAIEDSGA